MVLETLSLHAFWSQGPCVLASLDSAILFIGDWGQRSGKFVSCDDYSENAAASESIYMNSTSVPQSTHTITVSCLAVGVGV